MLQLNAKFFVSIVTCYRLGMEAATSGVDQMFNQVSVREEHFYFFVCLEEQIITVE